MQVALHSWYYLIIFIVEFLLFYVDLYNIQKVILSEMHLLSDLLSFLARRLSKKIWVFKNNPYLFCSFDNRHKYNNLQNSGIAISWILKAERCNFQCSRTFKFKNFHLGANQGRQKGCIFKCLHFSKKLLKNVQKRTTGLGVGVMGWGRLN